MTWLIMFLVVALLAYANGSNDNFKGVATLFGSRTCPYRQALLWATVTTALGSVTAAFLAGRLLHAFTGRGLVPASLAGDSQYVTAVALGAGLTVLFASRLGLPVSTTHGLVGALVGAGWAAGAAINGAKLGYDFFAPLLVSPFLAIALTSASSVLLRLLARHLRWPEDGCLCVGGSSVWAVVEPTGGVALRSRGSPAITWGSLAQCQSEELSARLGWNVPVTLHRLHYLSAGAVSFARGLNDTPKIAALLLVAPLTGEAASSFIVAVLIAVGGLLSARRVAEVMSHRVTPLTHGQGLLANLATSLIVIGASRFGLPVSTTHVSCGSLFGIGLATSGANQKTITNILAAWVTTLPLAALLSAGAFLALRTL